MNKAQKKKKDSLKTTKHTSNHSNKRQKKNTMFQLLTLLLPLVSKVSADCQMIAGNYYCSKTDAAIYSNVGFSGSYQDVTSMDEQSCVCSQQPFSFGGALAPFDEELSVHFRGPLKLSQFAVYYPASSNSKRAVAEEDCDSVVAKPVHKHKRDVAVEVIEVTETVFIDETVTLSPLPELPLPCLLQLHLTLPKYNLPKLLPKLLFLPPTKVLQLYPPLQRTLLPLPPPFKPLLLPLLLSKTVVTGAVSLTSPQVLPLAVLS